MPQIDFLPEKYRQRDVHRKNRWSRGIVVLVFVGLLTAGSFVLRQKRAAVADQLDAARQTHDAVMTQTADLARVVAKVSEARGQANLVAYLRHPWPRTRIVAALTQHWPEALTLQELRICREGNPAPQVYTAPLAPTPDGQAAKPPAIVDLQELRRDVQARPTVALLTGLMTDHAVLHRYLAELGKDDLFSNVELLGMAPAQAGGPLRFNVRLTIAPGYGQADGSHAPPKAQGAKPPVARNEAPATSAKQQPPAPTPASPARSEATTFTGVHAEAAPNQAPNRPELEDDETARGEGSP